MKLMRNFMLVCALLVAAPLFAETKAAPSPATKPATRETLPPLLPGVVALCGLPPAVGAWALSLIGLFNIAGSFASGWAIGRWRMKSVLSLLYAARAAAVLGFMFAPKTASTFMVFAVVLGFTYLSTVPPTVGLVGKLHGVRYVATLFGIVMLSHQIGGFLGAWLGGQIFERTGSYDWLWYIDIMLAIGAALIHMPIKEAPRLRPALAT